MPLRSTTRTLIGPLLGRTGQYHRSLDGLVIDGHVTLAPTQPPRIPLTCGHDLLAGHVVALFDHPAHGTWCVAVVDSWDDDDPRRSFSLGTSARPTTGDVGIAHARADYHAVRLNEVSLVERPGARTDAVTVAHGDVRDAKLGHPFAASSFACRLLDLAHAANRRRWRDDPIIVEHIGPTAAPPAAIAIRSISNDLDPFNPSHSRMPEPGVHRRYNVGTIASVR